MCNFFSQPSRAHGQISARIEFFIVGSNLLFFRFLRGTISASGRTRAQPYLRDAGGGRLWALLGRGDPSTGSGGRFDADAGKGEALAG